MKQGFADFYEFDSLWKIMKEEEKKGKLRQDYYSPDVKIISGRLKQIRSKLRNSPKSERGLILQDIAELRGQLDESKKIELRHKASVLSEGKADIVIESKTIKGHQAFVAKNLDTMLVCQLIKLELSRSYKLYPANMDMIIEQIKGLLDNDMPKIVIRADIHGFSSRFPNSILCKKFRMMVLCQEKRLNI